MTTLNKEITQLFRWYVLAAFVWSLIALGLLAWNIQIEVNHAEHEAITEARSHFNKDKALRLWAASHGGVYVQINEQTKPNSHLSHIPERDLVTPSGKQLTLMNPAYMIRQIMDQYEELYGIKGRITSYPDKLFNPANQPDAWEMEALKAFEQGEKEVKGITEIDGEAYMRLMQPMHMNKSCLKCHGIQGYEGGDLRGGVGVAVPMARYKQHESEDSLVLAVSYSIIWLLGLSGMFMAFRLFKKRTIERVKLESKLRKVNCKLEKYSYQDGLTLVANRRMFDALLKREWAAAMRNRYRLSLIMIDIDLFKGYNDGYGHQAGDICLRRVATTLNAIPMRNTDLVARYGGEEFVVLLPNTSEKQALRLANRCHKEVAALQLPHEYSGVADIVTISVGVTTILPAEGAHYSMLIEAADQALYQAKNNGRNCVNIWHCKI